VTSSSNAQLHSSKQRGGDSAKTPTSEPVTLTLLGRRSAAELVNAHRAAVAHGARETGAGAQIERLASVTELLSDLIPRLAEIAISTFVVQTLAGGRWDERLADVVEQLRQQSAGCVRLSQRALEVHARTAGYRLERWNELIVETTAEVLDSTDTVSTALRQPSTPLCEVRIAAAVTAAAIAACERDRMAVPGYVSEAIAHLLVLFMLAGELQSRHR
jgi:hypothetical protein